MAKNNTLLYIIIAVLVILLLARFGILGPMVGTVMWLLNILLLVGLIYLVYLLIKRYK
jgi:hypothetical protein